MKSYCWWIVLLIAWPFSLPVMAQSGEQSRFYIQQMIDLSATHDEQGVTTMQRMLEQSPRPTPVNPTAAQAGLKRGLAALQQNELEVALKEVLQATRDDPTNIDAVNHLGLIYRKMGRLPEAESALLQALILEPSRAVAWFQIAQVYGLQKDSKRALGAMANTYRFAQNPMRAEEILRNIAENEAADTLRDAALATLRLFGLPVVAAIVPPLPTNPGAVPLIISPTTRSSPAKRTSP